MRFDPWVNARVSLAGPIAGGAAALGVSWPASSATRELLLALAYAGFLLNLINLAPVWILDGAHVLRSWRVLRARRRPPQPGRGTTTRRGSSP